MLPLLVGRLRPPLTPWVQEALYLAYRHLRRLPTVITPRQRAVGNGYVATARPPRQPSTPCATTGLLVLDRPGAHSTTPAVRSCYQLLQAIHTDPLPAESLEPGYACVITTVSNYLRPYEDGYETLDPNVSVCVVRAGASRIFDPRLSQVYELAVRDYRTGTSPRPVAPRSGPRRRSGGRNLTP